MVLFLRQPQSVPEACGRQLSVKGLLFVIMNALVIFGLNVSGEDIVDITPKEQSTIMNREKIKCFEEMERDPQMPNDSLYCPRMWDDLLCWPNTPAGEIAEQPCPNYVQGFKIHEMATFQCMNNGSWYFSVFRNRTWTDFSRCSTKDIPINTEDDELLERASFAEDHMDPIRLIYNIGYGISLASLILSVVIMLGFKKLHCPRNTIHLHLFFSFILRASFSFMKENLLVEGVGFPSDVDTETGDRVILKNGTHWECKLFFTMFNYILGANYMWICAEALYLVLLIHKAVFTDRSGIRWYILFGWGSPFLFVTPWVIVKRYLENLYCWNIHDEEGYIWIMRGPIVLSIVVTFVCFISIVRVLFTKLNAVNSPEANRFRYRKLARSTLVLIPLFGVHYIIFVWYVRDKNHTVEIIQLYYEMLFNSIQGFFVALLYCFLNGEVQSEVRKKWQRFRITHLHHFPKGRTNSNNGTLETSYYNSRPRESNASVTLNPEVREQLDTNGTASYLPLKKSDSVRNGRGPMIYETPEEQPMIHLNDLSVSRP